MSETQRPRCESGDLVNSQEELLEALRGQPKGFNLQISVYWEDRQNFWRQAEVGTGQKIAVSILKIYSHQGKQVCLIRLTVV